MRPALNSSIVQADAAIAVVAVARQNYDALDPAARQCHPGAEPPP